MFYNKHKSGGRMKKILVVLCLACMLCACEVDKMKVKTCSYTNSEAMSKVNISAYYTSEDIPKIIVEMTQQYEDEIAKTLGEEKIVRMVQNAIVTTIGNDIQIEVEYDEKKQKIYVKMTMFTEDMQDDELKSLNLHKSKKIKNFVKHMESLNYKCKDVQ